MDKDKTENTPFEGLYELLVGCEYTFQSGRNIEKLKEYISSKISARDAELKRLIEGMKFIEKGGGWYQKGEHEHTTEFTAKWHNKILDDVLSIINTFNEGEKPK